MKRLFPVPGTNKSKGKAGRCRQVMRVLHIKGALGADGASAVEYSLARELYPQVVSDWLLDVRAEQAWRERFEALGSRIEILDVPKGKGGIRKVLRKYRTYRDWFRGHPYEAVHVDTDGFHRVVELFAAKRAGIPKRILHAHNTEAEYTGRLGGSPLTRRIGQWLYIRLATDYVACSDGAEEWLFGKKYADRTLVLKNGIDIGRFRFDPAKREEARKALGIGKDEILLGHVGRFERQKNHAFLLDVFRTMHAENPKARLLLIGEGSLREEIARGVREAGLEAEATFLGNTDDPALYYQAMDVFLLPSLFEGLPLAAVEAQCSGLPCLLTDRVSGQAKMTAGCVFLPIDKGPEPWAEAAREALRNPRPREKGSEEVAEAGYDVRMSARKLWEIYAGKDA